MTCREKLLSSSIPSAAAQEKNVLRYLLRDFPVVAA
jgi:hypothetical protein